MSSCEREDGADFGQVLIEELLSTGLALGDVLGSLLEEMPDDAFPGEDNGEVLIQMVVGSCRPAVEAAGEADCRTAIALIGAIRDRVFGDLWTAIELAKRNK